MTTLLLTLLVLHFAAGLNNGQAIRPPMGWRSWNQFGNAVSQSLIESIMTAIATPQFNNTSLAQLSFTDVGLDDAWQACGSYGPLGYTYHNASGSPMVNTALFPDLLAMTSYAHSLGLTAGFYSNNCDCADHCATLDCYAGDARAIYAWGFDSLKLDNCGAQKDLTVWEQELSATGRSFVIESCHWGVATGPGVGVPNATWCPFSFYRTSGDIEANYGSVISNLQTVVQWATKGLSGPGCYSSADMLVVGVVNGPHGLSGDPGLTPAETRTHFAAWCIVSSPLILSYDVRVPAIVAAVWPVVRGGCCCVVVNCPGLLAPSCPGLFVRGPWCGRCCRLFRPVRSWYRPRRCILMFCFLLSTDSLTNVCPHNFRATLSVSRHLRCPIRTRSA